MNQPLATDSDRSYGGNKNMLAPEPMEHPAQNWVKLIFLILMTFGLIVMMWFIWYFSPYAQSVHRDHV